MTATGLQLREGSSCAGRGGGGQVLILPLITMWWRAPSLTVDHLEYFIIQKKPTIQLLLYFLRIFGSRVSEPSLWPGSGFGSGFSFILSPRALGLPILVAVAQASAPALETARYKS